MTSRSSEKLSAQIEQLELQLDAVQVGHRHRLVTLRELLHLQAVVVGAEAELLLHRIDRPQAAGDGAAVRRVQRHRYAAVAQLLQQAQALGGIIDAELAPGVGRAVGAEFGRPGVVEHRHHRLPRTPLVQRRGLALQQPVQVGQPGFGEVAHLGVKVGVAHPSWIDTDIVRGAEADLPTFKLIRGKLPFPANATTTLADTVFSTVPGAPVFVGKSPKYRSKNEKLGVDFELSGHNALQSTFVFQG